MPSPTEQRRFDEARMRRRALRDTFAQLDASTATATCHCGEPFATCRGCGAPRCPACEPVRDDDCLWGV